MYRLLPLLSLLLIATSLSAQKNKRKAPTQDSALHKLEIPGLQWRSVGPALTSGRISDIAVNPTRRHEYYVATASGGVWKTVNHGVTYEPIFDSQGSYSIGCVTMDPQNSNIIWVGTGENNNQRSVAYGDGVYKSMDGGKSWQHMGLKQSEHIAKIIVHPDDSDVVYVAAIGPLWNKGGDRGLYKTIDGGANWEAVLEIDEHTGVTDVVMDPRDPDLLYAATHQRRRHVYTYVGGGPGSGLHRSMDGGVTWTKIQKGLPDVELGRIGLAISPANPDRIFAIVEAAEGKSGFFMSTNKGARWEKRGKHVTSGNYYQEIVADPVDEMRVYSMDTWMSVTKNGGKSFDLVGEDTKHVDNHCMWIDPQDNRHWIVGCDGGIYETYDAAKTWDFKKNLPVTQFYKVSVDNAEPFYHIYGGTQDNFSLGGPSRVLNNHGIRNSDWYITHGGDGFESQADPFDPNIIYAQSQYGVLVRFDKQSGEEVGIQPKPAEDENAYRFNWDAPLVASPHKRGRIYFAANKVFRSDDHGDSWEVISEDLSRQLNRNELKVYDRVVSIDAVMKNASTSEYGSVVAFAESTIDPELLAAGTDDGLVHISTDGGTNWRKVDNISGAPRQSYVNSVFLSKHDADVIYVAFNHHKYGDFKPYLFMSKDKGFTWSSISSNLPERGSIYAIEEDHVDADLLFVGTEFGAFFSPDRGNHWKALKTGLPTVAVRDIAIQPREHDMVLGTFGRGFYVLDDYSVLRGIDDMPQDTAHIAPSRTALMWEAKSPLGLPGKSFQGDNYYTADNLGASVIITYYYPDGYTSLRDQRRKDQRERIKDGLDAPYPTYDDLKAEREEIKKELVLTILNDKGDVVHKAVMSPKKGWQRYHWDLRYTLPNPINLNKPSFYNPFASQDEGTLVDPGRYTATLSLLDGEITRVLTEPMSFEVKALMNTTMPADNRTEKVAFQKDIAALQAQLASSQAILRESKNKMKYIHAALKRTEQPIDKWRSTALTIDAAIRDVELALYGDGIKRRLDMGQPMSPVSRLGSIGYEQKYSTSKPTKTHRDSYAIAKKQLDKIKTDVETLYNTQIKNLEKELIEARVPYTPGRGYEE